MGQIITITANVGVNSGPGPKGLGTGHEFETNCKA